MFLLNIAIIKAKSSIGTETHPYPKDEVEHEKQIFDTFHPALHFAHGARWIVAVITMTIFLLACRHESRRYWVRTGATSAQTPAA